MISKFACEQYYQFIDIFLPLISIVFSSTKATQHYASSVFFFFYSLSEIVQKCTIYTTHVMIHMLGEVM